MLQIKAEKRTKKKLKERRGGEKEERRGGKEGRRLAIFGVNHSFFLFLNRKGGKRKENDERKEGTQRNHPNFSLEDKKGKRLKC